jgi:hypothetical protein
MKGVVAGSWSTAAGGNAATTAGATVGTRVGATGAQFSAMIALPETVPAVAVTVIVPVPMAGAE